MYGPETRCCFIHLSDSFIAKKRLCATSIGLCTFMLTVIPSLEVNASFRSLDEASLNWFPGLLAAKISDNLCIAKTCLSSADIWNFGATGTEGLGRM